MRYIILLFTAAAIFAACSTGNNSTSLFGTDKLETARYEIDTDRDTTIETAHGALLKIPRGALATDKGNKVTLEIKEAYSMQQIILAGLTTQSNGDPLSSGGMIYINAAAGQKVTVKQKIQVAIPAGFLQSGMQLFKGEEQAGGRINWVSPDTLPVNPQLASVDYGQLLFQKSCSGCHTLGRDMAGPDLAHFMKRFPPGEKNTLYYGHVYLPEADSVAKKDTVNYHDEYLYDHSYYDPYFLYKCNLASKYNRRGPAVFPESDASYPDEMPVFRYLQNESDRLGLPLPSHAYLKDCADSCIAYRQRKDELQRRKEVTQDERRELVEENGSLVYKKPDSTWGTGGAPPPDLGKRVSPENYEAEYYQFTITSLGWFNIDMLLENVNGVKESELFVRVAGPYQEKIKMYLVIPSVKVYGEGGPAERNDDEFAFFYRSGKLPLPQNAKAYILAVTETGSSIAFGIKEFITGPHQELTVELHAASKEEFTNAMQSFDAGRLHITVKDAKNADAVRATDKELKNIDQQLRDAEQLRPKNCDCDCNITPQLRPMTVDIYQQ